MDECWLIYLDQLKCQAGFGRRHQSVQSAGPRFDGGGGGHFWRITEDACYKVTALNKTIKLILTKVSRLERQVALVWGNKC